MEITKQDYKLLAAQLNSIIEKLDSLTSPKISSLATLIFDTYKLIGHYDINRGPVLKTEADKLKHIQDTDKNDYQELFDNGKRLLRLNINEFIIDLEVLD